MRPLVAVTVLLAAWPAWAQPPAPAPAAAQDPVVARVEGEPVRLSEVTAMARSLPEQLRAAPPQMIYPLIVDQLITTRAITAAARRAGLHQDPEVRARIRQAEEQELVQALLAREVGRRVDEAAVRARWEREVAGRAPEEEVRVRHILLPSEAEARAALDEIRNGAEFATVAARIAGSGGPREGGDLGFFKREDLVPEFAEAAFALQPGQLAAAPIRTRLGWHVLKVEERRRAAPPSFEESRDALRQQMLETEVNTLVERLRSEARVERFNLDGSTIRATDTAEPPPAAAPPARGPRR